MVPSTPSPLEESLLAGIKILDFTIAMAGPLATQRLAELGADVTKIEVPKTGDLTRLFAVGGAKIDDSGVAYFALNHNKKSVVIDLKSEAGRTLIKRLIRSADVLIQNFRPGVAERLGIGYDDVLQIKPDIIYASISGYGTEGPLLDAPGQDLLVQSFSGLTFNAGRDGDPPHQSPVFLIDTTASHLATSGVLAALVHRLRTGQGEHIKVSLLGAALEMQSQELAAYSLNGLTNQRVDAAYANVWLDPPYGIYQTADGWVAFAQNDLSVMAGILKSEELHELAKLQSSSGGAPNSPEWRAWRETTHQVLSSAIKHWQSDDLVEQMSVARVWCGPVLDYASMTDHPQSQHYLGEVELSDGRVALFPRRSIEPTRAQQPEYQLAPALGADTDSVLMEAGLTPQDIENLRRDGAFG